MCGTLCEREQGRSGAGPRTAQEGESRHALFFSKTYLIGEKKFI